MSTYLYVKTHNVTGLKYLGKTTKKDPHTYTGSGTRWKKHLETHGYDYSTEILRECSSKDEVKHWGTYYSKLWNVVDDKGWANLKLEEGDGGARDWTDEARAKMSTRLKGRTFTEDHRRKLSEANKGKSIYRSPEDKAVAAAKASEKLRGKKKPEGFGEKIRQANIGTTKSEESRAKMRAAWTSERKENMSARRKAQNLSRQEQICPKCGQSLKTKFRYHYNACSK